MDQLHESLDGLLFIKPLKRKWRPVSDRSHLTEWKGSPSGQQKSTAKLYQRHLTAPACTQAQHAQAVAEFGNDPRTPRGRRPCLHEPMVHLSTGNSAHWTPWRQSQEHRCRGLGCAPAHSPAAPGRTRASPALPRTSLSRTGSACAEQVSHQLLTTLMFMLC